MEPDKKTNNTITICCTVMYCSKEPRGSLIVRNMLGLCYLLKTEVAGKLRWGWGGNLTSWCTVIYVYFCYDTTRQTVLTIDVRKPLRWQWNGGDSWFRLGLMIQYSLVAGLDSRDFYGLITPAIYWTIAIGRTIVWKNFIHCNHNS